MSRRRHGLNWPRALVVAALFFVGGMPSAAPADGESVSRSHVELPAIRRVFVPIDQPDRWPKGDWQPIERAEWERRMDAARNAMRERPVTFVERAEYSATLVDGELKRGRLDWHVRRPDPGSSLLSLGR